MPTYTKNYNLKKPSPNDYYDVVSDLGENLDKIDEELGKGVKKVGDTMSGTLEFNRGSYALRNYKDVFHCQINSRVTGVLKIVLPKSWTNTMMNGKLRGFDYSWFGAWELEFTGYNYAIDQTWINATAKVDGDCPFRKVRFAYDGAKCCILLGDVNTVWEYPALAITEFIASSSGITDWGNGWDIVFLDSETGITKITNVVLKGKEHYSYDSLCLNIPNTSVTVGQIAEALGGNSEASFEVNNNPNFPYPYSLVNVKVSQTREVATFEAINRSGNLEAVTQTIQYFYSSGGVSGGWKPVAHAIAPTETIITSGFNSGWSGTVKYGVDQEGRLQIRIIGMTKISDITSYDLIYQLPAVLNAYAGSASAIGFTSANIAIDGSTLTFILESGGKLFAANHGYVKTNVRKVIGTTIFASKS